MVTNYKFIVYRFNYRTRPLRMCDYVFEAESFFDALVKFTIRSPYVRHLNQKKLDNLKDLNVYSSRSISRITCRVDVYVETVKCTLSGDIIQYDKLQSFEV